MTDTVRRLEEIEARIYNCATLMPRRDGIDSVTDETRADIAWLIEQVRAAEAYPILDRLRSRIAELETQLRRAATPSDSPSPAPLPSPTTPGVTDEEARTAWLTYVDAITEEHDAKGEVSAEFRRDAMRRVLEQFAASRQAQGATTTSDAERIERGNAEAAIYEAGKAAGSPGEVPDAPTPALWGNLTEVPKQVTRVELIDHRTDIAASQKGRVFVAYGIQVALEYQDDGRTLKVFVDDRRAPPTGRAPGEEAP